MTTKPKFYTFNQNNSGGSFVEDPKAGIGIHVIIEAASEKDAVNKAKSIGLYFDGDGDCPCCGDRWTEYCDETDTPTIYGKDVSSGEYKDTWGDSYIHYLDGTIKLVSR